MWAPTLWQCDSVTCFRSRRNTTATTISQSGVGALQHHTTTTNQNLQQSSQNINSSNLHTTAVGGKYLKSVTNCRLHHLPLRWDISPDVCWDSGGVGLVSWPAGDHPDPSLCLSHGLQQGKEIRASSWYLPPPLPPLLFVIKYLVLGWGEVESTTKCMHEKIKGHISK